jgi:hypothetical protein
MQARSNRFNVGLVCGGSTFFGHSFCWTRKGLHGGGVLGTDVGFTKLFDIAI